MAGVGAPAGATAAGALHRVQAVAAELSPRLRTVAVWVLAHPQDAVAEPLEAIARAARVSPATVVRLCQRVGYRGFRQFQLALALELAEVGAPQPLADLDHLERADDFGAVAEAVVGASQRMLASTAARLSWPAVEAMARVIAGRRRLGILAQGASVTVAVDLHYHLSKLGRSVHLLTEPYAQAIHAAASGPDDSLLAISYAGHNPDLLEAVRLGRGNGAVTLALTARGGSPLARAVDQVLTVTDYEAVFRGEPFTSRLAFMLAADLLFLAVARALPESTAAWQRVHAALKAKRRGRSATERSDDE